MTERGGPTAQNIVYQNKIAALYLGDLLSLDGDSRDRVTEVRIEAPAHVDDVVVRYADGHRLWIQVKQALTTGTDAWTKLWQDLAEQRRLDAAADFDRLAVVLGVASDLAALLQECAARTCSSADAEWRRRLSKTGLTLVMNIDSILGTSCHPIFERLSVETITEDALRDVQIRSRMPPSNVGAETLHDTLTTLAGDAGRRRAALNLRDLQSLLRGRETPVLIEPPQDWGLPTYNQVLANARISVPGTPVGGAVATTFCWPRTALTEEFQRDFDDEQQLEELEEAPEALDLQLFPTPDFSQAIVHAGPGFGKSALLVALSQRLAGEGRYTPAIVPLGALAEGRQDVLSYLNTTLNTDYGVNINWTRLLETGSAVILFDGFDEVPVTRRAKVTERLAIFTGRFPDTPWLLSVRDPAYVPAMIDARKVELLPLLDREMKGFIEHISPGVSDVEVERLTMQIEAYPDLQRLVRIPLFLALLVATQRPGEPLPSRRSELIEAYLKTLFHPEEHKAAPRLRDAGRLREALQALAFDLLTKGKIGALERTIERFLKGHAGDGISVEELLDDAKTSGILRRDAGSRLSFPFPIVQEYLAAQQLVEHHSDQIASRVDRGVDRPWAQTIQFALEQVDDASEVARELLAKPDDPFASAARLLARCVINGMACDADVRAEIGDRLMTAWLDQSFWTKRRIGQLLRDGWARPLSPRLRGLILQRNYFYDGGGDILADLSEEALTVEFLIDALERNWLPPHLQEFQTAVDKIASRAFTLYIDSVRRGLWSDDRLWQASSVIRNLPRQKLLDEEVVQAAQDDNLPTGVRLACLGHSRTPDETLLNELVIVALRAPDASDRWPALHALRALTAPEVHLAALLRRDDLHENAHTTIIEHIADALPEPTDQIAFLRNQATSTDLDPGIRLHARVWTAVLGDGEAIRSLVQDFEDLPEKVLRPLIWSINKTPEYEAGERLVEAMRARPFPAEERVRAIGHLIFGATHNVRVFGWDFCSMDPAKPHVAFPLFVDLLAEWRTMDGYDLESRLRLETDACRAHLPGAGESLRSLATEVALTGELGGEKNPLYSALHNALRQLERRRLLIPLSAAIRLTDVVDPIERQATLSHVGAMGTREALEYLLTWSGRPGYQKSVALHGIEQTAARLGLKIVRQGKGLAVAGS